MIIRRIKPQGRRVRLARLKRRLRRRARGQRAAQPQLPFGEVVGPLYHGSREEFTEFDETRQRTAVGFFLTPDPATASFYGPWLYTVEVAVRKVADLDDWTTFREIGEHAFWEDAVRVMKHHGTGQWIEMTDANLLDWFGKWMFDTLNTDYFDDAAEEPSTVLLRWRDGLQRDVEAVEGAWAPGAFSDWLSYDASDEEDLLELVGAQVGPQARAQVLHALDANTRMMSPQVAWAYNAHYEGSQNWYMHYQDDMVLAAFALGYNGIWMSDPSPTGAPISFVVRDAEQIRILDRTWVEPTR